jgi:hypothetical protein
MKHADIIKRLIREALSTPPKKDKCNCGCHTCKNVGNPGPVLNENLTAKIIMSENMKYHVDNKVALTENTFRYGSDAFLDLWAEARYLYSRNAIHVNDLDKEILLETNLGEYGIYEGKKVPLDLPMLEEDELGGPEDIDTKNINYLPIKANEIPLRNIIKRAQEKNLYGTPFYNKLISQVNQKSIDMDEVKNILRDYGYYYEFDHLLNLNENKDKKKTPPLGKPKRGGSKKFYVYVRNPKTKKIKKVSFGQGGMSAKINNPKARKAFAARHKCAQKTDKTKASYWSCRLPRYAKLLGLKSSFSGFW